MNLVKKIKLVVVIIIFVLSIAIVILVAWMYKRYVPIKNIPCKHIDLKDTSLEILDIRAYNARQDNLNSDSIINIPYSYLERYNNEIPLSNIHVIASDKLERNLGIRFLLGKGIKVKSYEILN